MEQPIGALWQKRSKKGTEFMSGTISIEGKAYEVVIFKNSYKKEPKHPDWKVYPSKPREDSDFAAF